MVVVPRWRVVVALCMTPQPSSYLSPEMLGFFQNRSAFREYRIPMGLLAVCEGSFTTAVVFGYLVAALDETLHGRREWIVDGGVIWVSTPYADFWKKTLLPERRVRRALLRLEKLSLIERRRFGPRESRTMHTHLLEDRFLQAWNAALRGDIWDAPWSDPRDD